MITPPSAHPDESLSVSQDAINPQTQTEDHNPDLSGEEGELIERLSAAANMVANDDAALLEEAASTLSRLTAERDEAQSTITDWQDRAIASEARAETLQAEVERLRGERDRFRPIPTDFEDMFSVVYRTGTPTAEDYDEAIEALQNARTAWVEGDNMGCAVCSDSGHSAYHCHHNPLLLARKWAAASRFWQCWHCGYVATNDAEGEAHFGDHDGDEPSCVKAELEAARQKAEAQLEEARSVISFSHRTMQELLELLRADMTMQGRDYVGIGIQLNTAVDRAAAFFNTSRNGEPTPTFQAPKGEETAAEYNARFDPANEAGQETFDAGFRIGWMHATYPEGWPDDEEESRGAFNRAVDSVEMGEAWDAHRDQFFAHLPLVAVASRNGGA